MLFCITFVISLFASWVLVSTKVLHQKFTIDSDFTGVQKFHRDLIPRVGGAPVFIGIILGFLILELIDSKEIHYAKGIFFPMFIVFGAGFLEDITKRVSPLERILFFVIAIMAGIYITKALGYIDYSGFRFIDHYLRHHKYIAATLTFVALIGFTNAYNIIDGFNGLASITAIFNLLGIALICHLQAHVFEINATRAENIIGFLGAICGFLVFNYPRARIFLGDSGAYFIGFVIAVLSIKTIQTNEETISPVSVLLLGIYPITEIAFSIYRKRFLRNTSPTQPDGLHLHMLIYKRCTNFRSKMRNPSVVIIMLILIVPQTILAVIYHRDTSMCVLFSLVYIFLYFSIVRFKTSFIFKFLLGRV